MTNKPDDFQNRLAGIFMGMTLILMIAAVVSAGLRTFQILDDGVASRPSEWKGR